LIYRAATAAQAEEHLTELEAKWKAYPSVSQVWRRNWARITPFFHYPPEIRRAIYTTNSVESLLRAENSDIPSEPTVLVVNVSQVHDIQRRAQVGEAEAQYILGAAYRTGGPLLAKDLTAAAQWWHRAAGQGHAQAQNGLGYMYQNGEGVSCDYAEAARWYRLAAEQGNAAAENNLGNLYFAGKGVHRSYSAAFEWVAKAAKQGLATAQHGLGYMYRYGKGATRNIAEALNLFHQAARQGMAQAQNERGAMYLRGEGVTRDPAEAFPGFNWRPSRIFLTRKITWATSTAPARARPAIIARHCAGSASPPNRGWLPPRLTWGPLDYVAGYMWLSLAAEQGSKTADAGKKSLSTIMTKDQLAAADARRGEWKQQHSAPLQQAQAR
jgi:TPR repeat protein